MKKLNKGLITYLFVCFVIIVIVYKTGILTSKGFSSNSSSNCDQLTGTWVKYLDHQMLMVQTKLVITKVDKNRYEVKCNGSCFGSLMEYQCQNGVLQTTSTFAGASFIKRLTYNSSRNALIDESDYVFVRQ